MGTIFKVYLPVAQGPAAVAAAEAAYVEAPSTGGLALVVEDEPAVRDVTTRLLERAGYTVLAVGSGAQAIAAAEASSEPIDVLVTDAVMPGMSGIKLADYVHTHYPDAAVVILSGYTAETLDLERTITRGARFLAKPVSSRALLAAVGAALADRKGGRVHD
jgi:two-component system, cell cycle sensor histidine kinase and response regulator CckA